jgi:hypothetical protein
VLMFLWRSGLMPSLSRLEQSVLIFVVWGVCGNLELNALTVFC